MWRSCFLLLEVHPIHFPLLGRRGVPAAAPVTFLVMLGEPVALRFGNAPLTVGKTWQLNCQLSVVLVQQDL